MRKCALLTAVLLGLGPTAGAQPARTLGPDAPPIAEQRYQLGVKLYAQGEFERAADEFHKAKEIFPGSARLAYNLARALERAQRLEEAATSYREYVALAPQAEDRESVERLIAALDRRIEAARPELILISRPPGARVSIDAAPLQAPTPTRTKTDAGTHLVELRLPDRDAVARSVTLATGQIMTLEVTLPAREATVGAVEAAAVPEEPVNWAAWATAGLGVLGLGAGVALHLLSRDTADEAAALGPSPSQDARRADLRDDYDGELTGARLGYGLGGALLIGGGLWLWRF